MKKYFLMAVAVVSGMAFSSCTDFLDVQPEGNPSTTTYFQNDQQAIDAIDAVYSDFHQEAAFGREFYWPQGAACDVVWGRTRGYSSLATFQYNGDESPLRDFWFRMYRTMSRANWVIEQLLKKEAKTALTPVEKRSLGEAFFMRGFAHFYIAYRYGTDELGVPFTRYEDFEDGYDYSIPEQRATVMENYQLVIEDMDQAIAYLPAFESYGADERGRAHKAAAVGYKARCYAYWATWEPAKWANVIEQVNLLEKSYGRDLANTFEEVFSCEFADFWNKEYIWTIPSNGGSEGGGTEFPGVCLENKGWGKFNGWGQNKPSLDIYEELAKDGEGNVRLVNSLLEYNQEFKFFGETRRFYSSADIESGFQIWKFHKAFEKENPTETGYVNPNGDWPTVRINFPLLRFADCLLLRAEAYLMTGNNGGATNDINRIRNRSNLTPLLGQATMADLYHERRAELAFEFTDHLFDLKRWARSSNAEIKAIALNELNAKPRVRNYENRSDPESTYTVGIYADYAPNKLPYNDKFMTFPYPSKQITDSNGKLQNLSCWK